MNKHGQSLVLFVIFIPLLLGLCALVVDMGLVISKRVQLEEVSKTIIETIMEEPSEEAIQALFIENDIPVEHLEVQIDDGRIHLSNSYEIDSIFGVIIGLTHYEIQVDLTGSLMENKVVFE